MICIPIMARDSEEAADKMQEAASLADLFEIRLDVMSSFRLQEIISLAPKPVIITYRSRLQGGQGEDDYSGHVQILSEARAAGADFIDLEHTMPADQQDQLLKAGGSSRIILSCHVLHETPPRRALEKRYASLARRGPDIVKIVTHANVIEDNLRVLDLIPVAREQGTPIITFCMGPLGRISRVVSPLLGGFLTFASFARGEESAPGQLTAEEMRGLTKVLSP